MEEKQTPLEKILAGKLSVREVDWNADFNHDEIRTLLDEHIVEARQLPEIVASDMVMEGLLDYEEYPFEDFSPYEQLRQLDGKAITPEAFWKKINVEAFQGEDMEALLQHVKTCRIIIREGTEEDE